MPFLSPNQQCQSTEGGKISQSMDLLTPSSPGGLPTLSLTTNSSWLPWERVAMPLVNPLMSVPHNYRSGLLVFNHFVIHASCYTMIGLSWHHCSSLIRRFHFTAVLIKWQHNFFSCRWFVKSVHLATKGSRWTASSYCWWQVRHFFVMITTTRLIIIEQVLVSHTATHQCYSVAPQLSSEWEARPLVISASCLFCF